MCLGKLRALKTLDQPDRTDPVHLTRAQLELKEEVIDGRPQLIYKGHHISKMTSRTQFVHAFKAYIQAIIDNLEQRVVISL